MKSYVKLHQPGEKKTEKKLLKKKFFFDHLHFSCAYCFNTQQTRFKNFVHNFIYLRHAHDIKHGRHGFSQILRPRTFLADFQQFLSQSIQETRVSKVAHYRFNNPPKRLVYRKNAYLSPNRNLHPTKSCFITHKIAPVNYYLTVVSKPLIKQQANLPPCLQSPPKYAKSIATLLQF